IHTSVLHKKLDYRRAPPPQLLQGGVSSFYLSDTSKDGVDISPREQDCFLD
ncbi:hypothetical protein P5673_023744, partial [Acropora cervicornis]